MNVAPDLRVTPREKEVLVHLSNGKTTDLIGEILGIRANTVNTYKREMMDRFGAANVTSLVAAALRRGIIQ
ncbi:helix-turn-helix domain-containing protein [Rhizobium hidalgonense]|uniref:Helix-turn-helix domain-containing protein n=1 Tax=Rhizobium hidalgonense TaxID=1538159 RepID=A0AAJ2GWG5_9HYPH|nr:helix-turn-helix domain-containing protein [Rhizobium hidalgonense]MDR9777217.1 helix-turn-helix domain-containing protein [Rhizobium hidalgonense]